VFAELARDSDVAEMFLDGTVLRDHRHSSGAVKKKGRKRSGARVAD
jgi:hypothetical protein